MKLPCLKSLPSFLIWPVLPGIVKYPFVCGFVLLTWNFPLGCSKATLSAPCFLLQPSTPLANTLWAEAWPCLAGELSAVAVAPVHVQKQDSLWSETGLGAREFPACVATHRCLCTPLRCHSWLLFPSHCCLCRSSRKKAAALCCSRCGWPLDIGFLAAPIGILVYYADNSVPYEITRVNLTTKKDLADNIFTVIRRYLLVSAIVAKNQGRM